MRAVIRILYERLRSWSRGDAPVRADAWSRGDAPVRADAWSRGDAPVRADGGLVDEEAAGAESSHRERYARRLRDVASTESVRSSPFWLPPLLLMALFVYGAIGWNLVISLTDYSGFTRPTYTQFDLEMYVTALTSSQVISTGVNTFLLMISFTVACLTLGLGMAILIDREIRFENTVRTMYLLPMSLSFVVTAQFWLWMFDFDNGIVNSFLGLFGLGPFDYLGNPKLALWAIVFALVWQFSGYTMVVYLASLRNVPDDLYDAARVDGLGTAKMYWHVIIPQLKGAVVSASVVLMVFGLKAFDFLFALTGGLHPPNGADILGVLMVREAFAKRSWAYASAIAGILFVMTLSIIGPYLYWEYKNDNL